MAVEAKLRSQRNVPTLCRVVLVALGVALGGCVASPGEPKPQTPVILLTVDTLRADHLTPYGYPRDTSPNLAAFARDCLRFDRAFTPRGKTTPAYASMFTGLYPDHHGLKSLGARLHSENITLAERLSDAGFYTLGFASSTVMQARLSAFDQGFELWDDDLPTRESIRTNFERQGQDTTAAVLRHLGRLPDEPLFLFVHWIDPHGPYAPPEAATFRFEREPGKRTRIKKKVSAFQRLSGAEFLEDYIAAYDSEVRFVDEQVGRVLDRLKELGLYDASLILFTSDHGESLGEHDVYFRHGWHLHDASYRVPLLIKPPKGGVKRESWAGAVSLIDLLPTVLDYVELEPMEGLDGRSLRPLLEGLEGDADRIVFADRAERSTHDRAAHWREGSLWAQGCLVDSQEPFEGCETRYFDTQHDPQQQKPRTEGVAYARLYEALSEYRQFLEESKGRRQGQRMFHTREAEDGGHEDPSASGSLHQGLPEEDLEALKSLGYLE